MLLLGGCVADHVKLGISDLEWSSLALEKKQSLIINYRRVAAEQRKIRGRAYFGNKFLLVRVFGGQVMFPPSFVSWQDYKAINFSLATGECRNLKVTSKANPKEYSELRACFLDNILYLDSSRYDPIKKMGSVAIYSSPLWLEGFTYKGINSDGYLRLSNVSIEVKQQNLQR